MKEKYLEFIEYLKKYTDENHKLTRVQISSELEKRGSPLTRPTFKKYLDLAESIKIVDEQGLIDCDVSNIPKYYFTGRLFQPSTAKLLCHDIMASRVINDNEKNIIIKAIKSTQSIYDSRKISEALKTFHSDNTKSTPSFQKIEEIYELIASKKNMSFNYHHYNRNGNLANTNNKSYTLSPNYIICNKGYLYLRGYLEGTEKNSLRSFRIDKIFNVREVDGIYVPYKPTEDISIYDEQAKFTYMFDGKLTTITYRVTSKFLDYIFDEYGRNVSVEDVIEDPDNPDNTIYIVKVTTSQQNALLFAQQFMGGVQILEPEDVRNKFIEQLKNTLNIYKNLE